MLRPDEGFVDGENLKNYIESYASLSMISNQYILGNDNVRFTNHSTKPNLVSKKIDYEAEKVAMASRDIKKGEELTIISTRGPTPHPGDPTS